MKKVVQIIKKNTHQASWFFLYKDFLGQS